MKLKINQDDSLKDFVEAREKEIGLAIFDDDKELDVKELDAKAKISKIEKEKYLQLNKINNER